MRTRTMMLALLAIATCASALLLSCAANEPEAGPSLDPSQTVPVNDAGQTQELDAASEAVSPPCTEDCEYYPAACSSDALCPAGLFDPKNPGGDRDHFDWRTRLNIIRGRSANDVWAMGPVGALAHFDGTSWKSMAAPFPPASYGGRPSTFWAFWLREASEVGIVGVDRTFTRGLVDPEDPDDGVDAAAPSEWTDRGAITLTFDTSYDPSNQLLSTGWAAPGADELWLATSSVDPTWAGPNGLLRVRVTPEHRLEGEAKLTYSGTLLAMHGSAPDDFWAVGNGGIAMRVTDSADGSMTTAFYNTQTRNSLHGVWAASANDVWAVGSGGTVRHYAGGPLLWEVVDDVPLVNLNAVWGTSPSDVWAVGDRAVVLHFDGARWSRMKVGGLGAQRPNLTSVWTAAAGHVWIGGEGVLLSVGGTP